MTDELIPLFYPFVPKEARESVEEVLRSRFIGQGPVVDKFEREFSNKFLSGQYPVSVNSGTASLELAYHLIGLKEGDEVISTPLTCTATNIPLLRKGVKIIWADILEDTLCIDPDDVMSKITPNTKAIVQVHLGGIEAQVHNKQLSIPIVSDAAQALGIFTGDYTCCSFQAIKHITTIDGGMLVVNKEEEYKRAKKLRWFGIDRELKQANDWQAYQKRAMTFDIEEAGFKYHMHDVSASMGIVGLNYYDEIIAHRKKIFNIYKEQLVGMDGIRLVDGPSNTYWLATVIVERRDDFAKMLFKGYVDTNVVQVRNDIFDIFGGDRADLPVMNELEYKYLSIPLNMRVTEEDAYYISSLIRKGW
jgi:dTDP-4-amino-4,6-dideoxygalactose transaminase